ncbi:unnamed protein product [Rotaria socialis]|nr:unnamed protein product [Rotaria socialis]CAF3486795.1 unnamed protein product [Rotaria socialis]
MGCTKADHYQRPNSNNNQVIPSQGQRASVQTEPNYNSNVLLKVMEHQQFLTDITKQFLSGFKTEVEWANNVQEKTTVLIADVQQIKV